MNELMKILFVNSFISLAVFAISMLPAQFCMGLLPPCWEMNVQC